MEDLGLIAPGETPSGRDKAYIQRRYTTILGELAEENISYWDAEAIPMDTLNGLVVLMSLVVERSFGFPGLTGADFTNAVEDAKRQIRRRVAKPASRMPVEVDYF